MIKLISSKGKMTYDTNIYVCDNTSDLYQIYGYHFGDMCYVIHENATFIVDGAGKWIKMNANSSTVAPGTAPTSSVFGEGIMGDLIFGEG